MRTTGNQILALMEENVQRRLWRPVSMATCSGCWTYSKLSTAFVFSDKVIIFSRKDFVFSSLFPLAFICKWRLVVFRKFPFASYFLFFTLFRLALKPHFSRGVVAVAFSQTTGRHWRDNRWIRHNNAIRRRNCKGRMQHGRHQRGGNEEPRHGEICRRRMFHQAVGAASWKLGTLRPLPWVHFLQISHLLLHATFRRPTEVLWLQFHLTNVQVHSRPQGRPPSFLLSICDHQNAAAIFSS